MIDRDDIETRLAAGESLRSIARTAGVTYQTLQYHRRRWGAALLRPARGSGEDHASWRGGRFVDRFGYTMVLAPDAGRASKYVPEHVLVAEQTICRPLRRGEVVHHINGRKDDNRPGNLFVCTRSRHAAIHKQLETLAMEMLDAGAITFEDGHYAARPSM